MQMTKLIQDRKSAGTKLAEKLKSTKWTKTLVLGLPRGGVPVASQMAKELNLPWDILRVKKIGAPGHAEYAIGAIAEDDLPIWNEQALADLDASKEQLEEWSKQARKKMFAQSKRWGPGRGSLNIKEMTIIVVDDGLATGMTMRAAVEYLQKQEANRIIVAVPVASKQAVEYFEQAHHQVIALYRPEPFFSVGQWYEDFAQVTDQTVADLLSKRGQSQSSTKTVSIAAGGVSLTGELSVPKNARGLVLFAHGSGSSYKSPRNQFVAKKLNQLGFATLLFDLLTTQEGADRRQVFDIPQLTSRLRIATEWVRQFKELKTLPIGYFGASTGAAAALHAATQEDHVRAVVCRGGRPDLAEAALPKLLCPTLLIVGGEDLVVVELNRHAQKRIKNSELLIVPGATHLFSETGAMEQVVAAAAKWFTQHLRPRA
ncbi:MAG: alpha/beta family hydrolase [Bdellovibrionales bacterium]